MTDDNLAWVLSRSLWRQGLLAQPEIWRVEAYVDAENPASSRVMEKIGMTQDGQLDRWGYHPNVSDQPRDVLLFSITR